MLRRALLVSGLAQMRDLPANQIMAIAQRAHFEARPTVDGHFLPQPPWAIIKESKEQPVPVLVGATDNDLGTGLARPTAATPQHYRATARQIFGAHSAESLKALPACTDLQAQPQALAASRDSGRDMGMAALSGVTLQAEFSHAPAYLYLFGHVEPFVPSVTFADLPDPPQPRAPTTSATSPIGWAH